MNQADFWKLIEEVNQACPSRDHESMEAQMIERLIHHNVDDILDFHLIQQEYWAIYLSFHFSIAYPSCLFQFISCPFKEGRSQFLIEWEKRFIDHLFERI